MLPVPRRITARKPKQAHNAAQGQQHLREHLLSDESNWQYQKQDGGRETHPRWFLGAGTAYTDAGPGDRKSNRRRRARRPMAFANFVLKVEPGELGPGGEGTPVFAVRIDDTRLEYYDPANEGRPNELRTLLAAALLENNPGLTPNGARQQADARIREAREQIALNDWKTKILDSLNRLSSDAKRLESFLDTISTPRTRDEYYVDYELVFMGISARSLIHRRMQQRCPIPTRRHRPRRPRLTPPAPPPPGAAGTRRLASGRPPASLAAAPWSGSPNHSTPSAGS